MTWRISIKTVGTQQEKPPSNTSEDVNLKEVKAPQVEDFNVDVNPESSLSTLQDKIEELTGLSVNQQRLIYRGRLLTQGEDSLLKIGDIDGLTDGHTIHLVPRSVPTATDAAIPTVPTATATEENDSSSSVVSGNSTASLLATLLGLGSSNALSTAADSEDDVRDRNDRRRFQPNRRTLRRSQRPSQGIPPRAEPGSLEPCRQGLMTLHTMLNHSQNTERKWFKGQWLDCRDTVNQWLEATVVDIVTPQDILTPAELQTALGLSTRSQKRKMPFDADPIINASDYDGRRRLLIDVDDNGDVKLRDGTTVQLLLIHYNGWPHRWDEWIRSDSDRIRPFRTRTRHGSMAPYSSPTPQYIFQAAPSTCILTDDQSDRNVILTELSRTFTSVNALIHSIADPSSSSTVDPSTSSTSTQAHLPWLTEEQSAESKSPDCQQFKALAPLLDRLGRTLTDMAPHVAAYAASLEDSNKSESQEEEGESPCNRARISSDDSNEEEENPELADYVHGMVNAVSRENRRENVLGGPSGRETGGTAGSGGILGSIFSGAGDDAGALNRLLRVNNNGTDGGIDIHIHAIVTPTPGLAMFGAGGPAAAGLGFAMQPSTNFRLRGSNEISGSDDDTEPNNTPVPITVPEEDDLGLFSDLYSENPSPNEPSAEVLPDLQQPGSGNGAADNPIEEVLPLLEEVNVNSPRQENGEVSLDLSTTHNSTIEIDQSLSPTSRSGEDDLVQATNSMHSSTMSHDSNSSSSRQSFSRSSSSALFGRIIRRALGRRDDDDDE